MGGGSSERKSMGELRIMKDLEELDIGSLADVRADPTNMLKISVTAKPDEGFWRGGRFDFVMEIPRDYPHAPPKVKCTTEVRKESINVLTCVCNTQQRTRHALCTLNLKCLFPTPKNSPPVPPPPTNSSSTRTLTLMGTCA